MSVHKIVIADDHIMFRQVIVNLINNAGGFEVVGQAGNGVELLRILNKVKPHLVILDITMPKLGGLEAALEIKMLYPEVKVLMLTMHFGEQFMYHALSIGVDGYLLKQDSYEEIFAAIETIRRGRIYVSPAISAKLTDDTAEAFRTGHFEALSEPLTLREREVLKLIAEENTNQQIAELLFISPRTVQHHRAAIKRKLNIRQTAGLVKYAIRNGYTTSAQ